MQLLVHEINLICSLQVRKRIFCLSVSKAGKKDKLLSLFLSEIILFSIAPHFNPQLKISEPENKWHKILNFA